MGKTLNTFLNNIPKEKILFGKGQYLFTQNKKKYLDFTGGGTSNCVLGFNNDFVTNFHCYCLSDKS